MPNGPNLTLERSLRPARIVMKRHTNILLQSPGISNNNPLRALLVGNPEGRALYNTYSHGVFMHVHVHVDVRVHGGCHMLPFNNYAGALAPRRLLSC